MENVLRGGKVGDVVADAGHEEVGEGFDACFVVFERGVEVLGLEGGVAAGFGGVGLVESCLQAGLHWRRGGRRRRRERGCCCRCRCGWTGDRQWGRDSLLRDVRELSP